MSYQKPREIAARILLEREAKKSFVEELLERALAGSRLSPPDRGLVQEIAYGAVRWQAPLDWLIARKTAGKTQKAALQVLLRMGLYQLFWLSRVPDHAAVNETVQLAREMGCGPQSGFVNAVLRGYLRERAETEAALLKLKESDLALGYSHPAWLVERWDKRLGRASAVSLLEWNNTPPKTYARVNQLKADVNELRDQWAREKVEPKLVPVDWARDSLVFELASFPPLGTLPSFVNGAFYIQDPSTLLAVAELDPQPGETILDYCAAPGGKTGFIADRMKNQGKVVAHDTTPDRLELISANSARLGTMIVEPVLPSALQARAKTDYFDRVLVDAPCSNTGVMRRRVDLRWRIRATELERLKTTQLELLRDAFERLKPGGTLVYSTCSLEPEENSEVVQAFLKQQPGAHFQRERSLTPWAENVDGAYVAKLVKGT